VKAKGINGNGFGMTLGMASTLATWPTPQTSDGSGGGQAKRATEEARHGSNLNDFAMLVKVSPWATPAARDYRHANLKSYKVRGGGKKGEQLCNQVRMAAWPTPVAQDSEQSGGEGSIERGTRAHSLTSITKGMEPSGWSTPTSLTPARNANNAAGNSDGLRKLTEQAQPMDSGPLPTGSPAETAKPGQLNPAHSRWLMGLPAVWDACAPTETRSTLSKRRNSFVPQAK
jgi:hypothetical protein